MPALSVGPAVVLKKMGTSTRFRHHRDTEGTASSDWNSSGSRSYCSIHSGVSVGIRLASSSDRKVCLGNAESRCSEETDETAAVSESCGEQLQLALGR